MKRFIILIVVLILGCHKESSSPEPVPPAESKSDFTISKKETFPLEILTITLKESSSQSSIKGKIGSVDFEAQQVDGHNYAFLIPEIIAEGDYNLSIAISKNALVLKVKKPAEIPNPRQYNEDFTNSTAELAGKIKSSQDSLARHGHMTTAEAQAALKNLNVAITEFQKQLGSSPEAEIKTTAAFLRANKQILDSLYQWIDKLAKLPIKNARMQATYDEGDDAVDKAEEFQKEFAVFGPKISYCLTMISLAVSKKSKLLAQAAGIVTTGAVLIANVAIRIFSGSKIFLNDAASTLRTTASLVKNLSANTARAITAKVPVTTFDEDAAVNSSNSILKSVATSLSKLRKEVEKVEDPDIAEFVTIPPLIKPTPSTGEIFISSLSKLVVDVTNNAAVKAVVSNFNNGTFDLAFTSTQTTPATFDYKITYTYGGHPVSELVTGNTLAGGTVLTLSALAGVPFTQAGEIGRTYHFTVDGYTAKSTTNYKWNFGDGTVLDSKGDNSEFHSYNKAATYPISVSVTEGTNLIGTVSRPVTIVEKEIYTISTADGIPISKAGEINKSYTFSVQGSSWRANANSIVIWSFGDGTPDEQVKGSGTVRHVFTNNGSYNVKARVFAEDGALDEHVSQTTALIGTTSAGEYYFSFSFQGTQYSFPSSTVYAVNSGGGFHIVGDSVKLQTGIFFAPASKFQGVGTYPFAFNCNATDINSSAIGAHLYSFATYTPLASTFSPSAAWGCPGKIDQTSPVNGQVTITKSDGKTVEGTFYYTDVKTGQPVLNAKFKVPVR